MGILTGFFLKLSWSCGITGCYWHSGIKLERWDFSAASLEIHAGEVHTASCHEAKGIIPDLQNQQELSQWWGRPEAS